MAQLHSPFHSGNQEMLLSFPPQCLLKSAEIFMIYFVRLQNVCCVLLVVEIINPGYYNNILTLEKLERSPILLSNILCPQRLRLCCVILLYLSLCIDYDANLRQVCETLLQIFLDLGHFFFGI